VSNFIYQYTENFREKAPAVLRFAEISYPFLSNHSSYKTTRNNAVAIKFLSKSYIAGINLMP